MEALIKLQPILSLIFSIATFIGIIIGFYKFFRDPDIKANEEINLMKQACTFKHKGIDDDIKTIKTNHLSHIESDISALKKSHTEMKEAQVKIFTILEERLPHKNN